MAGAALKRSLLLGLTGGLLAGIASPPAVFPGAQLLVFVALAIWVECALRAPRPYAAIATWGFAWIAWLSWSLRHVTSAGVVGMPLLAVAYFALLGWLLRSAARRLSPALTAVWAALLWAALEWVRTQQPEIPYPHGQVSHSFYEWPFLLRPARIVSEVGMNLLVAGVATGAWHATRSRGTAAARGGPLAGFVAAWVVLSVPSLELPSAGSPVRVAAVQSGIAMYPDLPRYVPRDRFEAHNRSLRDDLPPDVDLVVWPESMAPHALTEDMLVPRYLRAVATSLARPDQAVLFGVELYPADARPSVRRSPPHYNSALLCSARSRVLLGRHDKRYLVPAGERLPFLPVLLPESWNEAFLDWLRERFPFVPNLLAGGRRDLPRLGGHPIGVTICFENAFATLFAQQVREGAAMFFVLSNEAWYRGGAEIDQMLAMTVLRALETGRHVVRATTDGWTCHVDPSGRIERLPLAEQGILRVGVPPVRGARPAVGWGAAVHWAVLAALGLLLALGKTSRGSAAASRPG